MIPLIQSQQDKITAITKYVENNFIALAAILLGLFNLWHTFYLGRRDRSNLIVTTKYFPKYQYEDKDFSARIYLECVNSGRRPIRLSTVGVTYEDNTYKSMYLGKNREGLELKENQPLSQDEEDLRHILFDAENGLAAIDIWFQDTLGKRHYAKNGKKNLKLYFSK